MYTKLSVMDFDGTLVYSPGKGGLVNGRPLLEVYDEYLQEQKLPPRKWNGWWGRKETLLPPIFGRYEEGRLVCPQESLNEEMASKVREYAGDDTVLSILLTGRHNGMRQKGRHVCEIVLESYGLAFDRYYYLDSMAPTLRFKCSTLDALLDEFPSIREVEMYEDRPDHVSSFCDFLRLRKKEGHIDHYQVTRVYTPEPSFDE